MPAAKPAMFALYWDESDEWDDSYEKVRRALFATQEEAVNQGMHDLLCLRCRVRDERGRTTLESTGVDPLDESKPCQDCQGTKYCPSRRVLRVEKIVTEELKSFHASSKGVAGPELNTGKVVWKPKLA